MKISKAIMLLVSIYLMNTGAANCDWQAVLDQNFDIVSTFDELQDWVGMAPDRAHGGYGNVGDPSWKFFNINTGFIGPWAWHDGPLEGDRRYGDTEILHHLKLFDETNVIHHLETQWQTEMWWADDTTKPFPSDRWAAVEYHFILEEPAYTGQNGTAEVWLYDDEGVAAKVMERHDVRFRSDEFVCSSGTNNHKFNNIVIGGNNSETYSCGQGMNCTYYIDDVIIDDKRIGPAYFQILGGANDTEAPAPPSNLRSVQ